MVNNTYFTVILNGTIESVKSIIPISVGVDKPTVIQKPITKITLGVLIELTGNIKGRIIIEGNEHTFSKIGEVMYGMSLQGEMLDSFTGELGNMIAGNLATSVASKGIEIDITPPTLLVNHMNKIHFDKALSLPIHFATVGSFTIFLMIEK